MNFFEHQDRARRQTRLLVVLFALAVVAIIVAVDAVVFTIAGPDPLMLLTATGVTALIIFGASTVRSLQLRAGGGDIARQLGGTRIEHDMTDPLRQRLRNVVEEMAIASGVPVPEIYVLEQEQGVNAFAAGFSPADAAVAVTRGTLEHLDRDELQGVIAHEFSHILNGDMRLNIRLIGFLFGILVIAIVGRKLLYSSRFARGSRNAAPAVMIGLAVVIIGYVGLFFGRWIKSAVSRQREYLADASAVQFTRSVDGIAGALKKIGALQTGSRLEVDTEEVGHMLFGQGMSQRLFATHPPLEQRIRAIDPGFDPSEFKQIAKRLDRRAEMRRAELAAQAEAGDVGAKAEPASPGAGGLFNAESLIDRIGKPGLEQVLAAALLTAELPQPLRRAARSDEWVLEVVCSVLLDADDAVRERQLLAIARALGSESERRVRALRQACPQLPRSQRLPLTEIAFPSLRKRPDGELVEFMRLLDELVGSDGRVDVFEYALSRLVSRQIRDSLKPETSEPAGRLRLDDTLDEAAEVLSILARHGHRQSPEQAQAAFASGWALLGDQPADDIRHIDNWPEALDSALARLDNLRPSSRQKLVLSLMACVVHDQQVNDDELDLLRVVCGLLHVPLPTLRSPA